MGTRLSSSRLQQSMLPPSATSLAHIRHRTFKKLEVLSKLASLVAGLDNRVVYVCLLLGLGLLLWSRRGTWHCLEHRCNANFINSNQESRALIGMTLIFAVRAHKRCREQMCESRKYAGAKRIFFLANRDARSISGPAPPLRNPYETAV